MKSTTITLAALLLAGGCAHKPWERALAGEAHIEVRPGEGAGNVKLGMGPGRVKRRLGEPAQVDSFSGGERYWTYPRLGLSLKFQGRELDALYCYSGVHGGYETRDYEPFPGATREGVTVHSSEREVLEAYGRPAKRERAPDAPIPASWISYPQGLGFCFTEGSQQMVYLYVD
jgi:hypothetical protein